MQTIMICLNQLGIGGIETATSNQTIQLIKRGYRVIILAGDGIYRQNFKQEGAIYIPFEFEVNNRFPIKKIEKLMRILEEYQVEQVHIQQFYCINTAFPACIQKGIPYIAYLHNGVKGAYDWFEQCFFSYSILFKLFFENAEKIIAIKESTKQECIERYQIEPEHCLVMKNSIDLEKFKIEENHKLEKIEKFLIIGRLVKGKEVSILNTITLFKEYYKRNPNAKLTIVGDGELREKIEDEVKEMGTSTILLGERNDISAIISQNDIVIALGRCVLEAISLKKVALISGYEQIKEIITPENIEKASENNLNGQGLKSYSIEEMVEQIQNLKQGEISKIVEGNYQYVEKNLNSSKNLYIIEKLEDKKIQIETKSAIKSIVELQNIATDKMENADQIYKEYKETQEYLKKQIESKELELVQLRKEKEQIEKDLQEKNKKEIVRNKLFEKIKKILEK